MSLSLLGYETGATQPPNARLGSGLSEDISRLAISQKHTLSQPCDRMNIAERTKGHQRRQKVY